MDHVSKVDLIWELVSVDLISKVDLIGPLGRVDLIGELVGVDLISKVDLIGELAEVGAETWAGNCSWVGSGGELICQPKSG